MNSYQLISKLRKVREDTYLTTASQALYHELVAICNETKWKDIFFIRSSVLCDNLDMSDNTLRKSRSNLADSGLIYYKTSKDKRIGCYYSFVKKLSNDIVSSAISSAKIAYDTMDNDGGYLLESPSESPSISSSEFEHDKNQSSAISSAKIADETQFTPYIENINYKQEESLAHTHESTPPEKPKRSKKKEGGARPLVYPFNSISFMSAWTQLIETPKWKGKLNYSLQLSLNKLAKFEEEFAVMQIERAIESNWTGVVFTGTERDYQEWLKQKHGNNQKPSTNKQEANEYALQQLIIESQRREQGLADEVEKPF